MNQGRLLGANSGRGSAWVIKSEWGKWVLRHYFRGGLYAQISRDRYFWTGLKNTRAYQEFELLHHIQQLNLPSPEPIAALISKQGMYYRNDLIMSHLQHEHTFAQSLLQQTPPITTWQSIGHTIASYHQHGIYHSDLNAHNILLNETKNTQVYLIDFDKGAIKTLNTSWQQDNLNRLKRSIEKISKKSCDNEFNTEWKALVNAYQESFN